VMVIDDLSSGHPENINPAAEFHLTDILYMREWVMHFKPSAIIHLAAQPSLRKSIDDPVEDATVNILGTLAAIEAAKAVGAYVVMASTSAVYDSSGKPPHRETDRVAPNLPYGIAKAAAEAYLLNSGLSCAALRYGNFYGPRQRKVGENQLVPHCLGYLLRGEPFIINGDGFKTRDFVYVGDIARANVLAAEQRIPGVYNCGTGNETHVGMICNELARLTESLPVFQHGPEKPGEARHVRLDSSKAASWWKAETSITEGLRRTVAHELQQRDAIAGQAAGGINDG